MKGQWKKLFSMTMIVCILASIFAVNASAASKKTELSTKKISDKNVSHYPKVGVDVGGVMLSDSALLIHDTTYVTLRAFSDSLTSADIDYSRWTRTATVVTGGLVLTASDGAYVVEANGRALFAMTPVVIMSDGKMYVPVRTLAKAYGVSVAWEDSTRSVSIRGNANFLKNADEYYNASDLYWLSRIINAESRGESLVGQIAVGNVVLNRVRSSEYPSTIYGVIFDKKYGVQFSPVLDGSIYLTPTYSSTLAAKIVLEGFTLHDGMLFFLAPRIATSSWIVNNRTYLFTIGRHDFYL